MWRRSLSSLASMAIFSICSMLPFIISMTSATSTLLPFNTEVGVEVGCREDFSAPPTPSPTSPSATNPTDLSTHGGGNRNETQREQTGSGTMESLLEWEEAGQQRGANEGLHQDSTIERGDGSQGHVANQGPPALQNCPAEPHICSNNDCGGNNGCFKCATQNPVYSLCQCCPDTPPLCADERCAASSTAFCTDPGCPPSQQSGRCESELLKGCICEKEQVYDEADVEFDPYEAEGLPDGPASEEYERAVRHVVEMFGGMEKLPGYMHPGEEKKGKGGEMGATGDMIEELGKVNLYFPFGPHKGLHNGAL